LRCQFIGSSAKSIHLSNFCISSAFEDNGLVNYTASRPAKFRKAVFLCCDHDFSKFAAFLIQQIAEKHPTADFDICLCSEDKIELPASLAQLPVRLCQIRIQDTIAQAPVSERINAASYLRLLLPSAFAADYDRILYLDADIFLIGGDLSRLLEVELLAGHPIAAVRTSHQRNKMRRLMPEFKKLRMTPAPYFNAGVLLIDVPRWEGTETLSRALKVISDHPDALVMHDQSVLNLVFRGRWSELSVVWNWMYSGRFSYMIEACDPFLIHFAGRMKPWNTLTGEFPPKYPNAYRDFFLQHYPEAAAQMPVPKSIFAAPKFHKKSLLKQWYDFNRFMPYMTRFDDPYCAVDPDV
jgi:lipopolysaccharide biosynthesis glycosyltransferase